MSKSRLDGRVAIVTGASRGLGRDMAERFAAEGASVVVAARSEEVWNDKLPGTIHDVVGAIDAAGGRAIAVRCDTSVEEDLERLVAETEAAFGACDLLVNNAAVTHPGGPGRRSGSGTPPPPASGTPMPSTRVGASPGILEMSVAGYRRHFDVGLFASYRLMQLVLPGMVAKGGGSIINISSDASRRPGEGPYPTEIASFIAYGGNKIALEQLSRGVAAQVAKYGVTVNSLSPSTAIDTPGQLWVSGGRQSTGGETGETFAECVIQLALDTPSKRTGWNAYTEEILHPENGRRGWTG